VASGEFAAVGAPAQFVRDNWRDEVVDQLVAQTLPRPALMCDFEQRPGDYAEGREKVVRGHPGV